MMESPIFQKIFYNKLIIWHERQIYNIKDKNIKDEENDIKLHDLNN